MKLKELFKKQSKLDICIIEEKGLTVHILIHKKILALQVELGELANEWRGFKFWSEDQIPRDNNHPNQLAGNPLLEEYVDCLHFILSIGLDYGMNWRVQDEYKTNIYSTDITKQFNKVFRYATELESELDYTIKCIIYIQLVETFLGLGQLLGFTEKNIVQAYMDKNKINHDRQENGY
ncbi:dUTP diphosphatase [Alkaliphilus sp. B6464]|uniref:dUTP diphosphatase n=1 Tax=Alkaliphilus sp. B6464 TaxID=2731219 RepID=UPI001BAD40B7|nr:dUTP diphosphatase [Alkaliphilus sp. B6464]QUH21442.1 dUTP diphosphatase [Alkaliphilus sp. B6464]